MKTEKYEKTQDVVVCRLGTPQCLWLLGSFSQIFVGLFVLLLPVEKIIAHPGAHDVLEAMNEKLLITPHSVEILSERAHIFANSGHFAEAQADVDKIRTLQGLSVSLETLQVRLFSERGEFAQAEKLLLRLIEGKTPEYGHIFALIEVYMEQGKWADADALYQRWLMNEPARSPEKALSLLHRFKKDGPDGLNRAYILLDKMIKNIGELPLFIDTKASWFVEEGRFEDAEVLLEQLYTRFPTNLNFGFRYGQLLEGLGRGVVAHQVYEASLARYAALPASRKSAPARLEAVVQLRDGLERTANDVE